jgi:hypothetical protein
MIAVPIWRHASLPQRKSPLPMEGSGLFNSSSPIHEARLSDGLSQRRCRGVPMDLESFFQTIARITPLTPRRS